MSRNRRRRGEAEGFTYIPEHVMESDALKTANHASFRTLAILIVGKPKERNGLMMCSNTYALHFGINSRETLARSLDELQERGLIVKTRQGLRMRKIPSLWAVTWWPIYYRDGKPLDRPEEPTMAYRNWRLITPIVGAETKFHTDHRDSVTPIIGVDRPPLHTDFAAHSPNLHTDYRYYSKSLGMGAMNGRGEKVLKLMSELPHLGDGDVSKITGEPIEFVQRVRELRECGHSSAEGGGR